MGEAVGNVLPLAVAVAVFPVPVIAAVLVLGSDRGTAKGLAFVLAWCVGLAAVGAIALVLVGVADGSEAGEPAEIAELGLPAGQQVAVLLVFVLLASGGVLTPLLLSLALGDRSRELLDGLRGWMARHNAVIMAVLFLLIGAKLIGDAISGFSG